MGNVEECYWCGEPATGRDHVFPRQFFLAPRPDLLTVPACDAHNKHLQKNEDYFRAFVAALAYPKPAAQRLWRGPIRRQLRRSPSLRARMDANVKPVSLYTPFGLFLGDGDSLIGESKRIEIVLEKMARGLHNYHHGTRLEGVSWTFQMFTPATVWKLPDLIGTLPSETYDVGDAVKYRFGIAADDDRYTIWFLSILGIPFLAVTTPSDAEIPVIDPAQYAG